MHRICLASVSVGEAMAGGRKTTKIGALRVQTKKSAAMYKLRLIFFVLKSCLYSAPLKYSPQKRKQGKRGPYGIKKRS
mgnify:CR=1 FL=1